MSNSNKPKPILNAFSSFGRTILSLFTFGNMNRTSKSILEEEAITSPSKTIVKNFMRNKLAIIGLTGIVLMTTFVFGGSLIFPFDVLSGEWAHKNLPPSNNLLKFPSALKTNGVEQIVSGRSFSIGLDKLGNVYTWGINASDILTIPEEVKTSKIVKIAAGDEHVLALSDTGKLFAWGNNSFEQGSVPMSISNILMIDDVIDMGGGDLYSYIITDKGRLYVWGGTLSNGLDIVPTRLQGNLASAGASTVSMLLLNSDQSIAYHGARGTQISEIPTYLLNGSVKLKKVEASIYTGLALDTNGFIHQWGFSGNGMRDIPEKVSFDDPNRISFVDIQAGRRHFVALGSDGNVYAWGDNEFGQLKVPASLKQGKTVAIYSDFFQNYALQEDGSLVPWGLKGFTLGSDENGKDIFIRLIHGGRITMTVGAVAVLISTFIGVLVGLIAGFYGKWLDNFLMQIGRAHV